MDIVLFWDLWMVERGGYIGLERSLCLIRRQHITMSKSSSRLLRGGTSENMVLVKVVSYGLDHGLVHKHGTHLFCYVNGLIVVVRT